MNQHHSVLAVRHVWSKREKGNRREESQEEGGVEKWSKGHESHLQQFPPHIMNGQRRSSRGLYAMAWSRTVRLWHMGSAKTANTDRLATLTTPESVLCSSLSAFFKRYRNTGRQNKQITKYQIDPPNNHAYWLITERASTARGKIFFLHLLPDVINEARNVNTL